MPAAPDAAPSARSEQERVRRAKRARLVEDGREAYPLSVPRTASLAEVRARHDGLDAGAETDDVVAVAGRVVFLRTTGRLAFATLQAEAGVRLQLMLPADAVGAEAYAAWKADVDLGDLVWARGPVVASKRGELSVRAEAWGMAGKALRPLPNLYEGAELSDEVRARQREVDLIASADAREAVLARAVVLRALRRTIDERGFVEVETPVLQVVRGGAAARPFTTTLHALDDLPMVLRIALELSLKRTVVGGIDRVYEIGRCFRNEGIDATHSPEFTMLEAYEAYGDQHSIADLTRELVLAAARASGRTVITAGGREVDLERPWRRVPLHAAVGEVVGEPVDAGTPVERLRGIAAAHGVALRPDWGAGDVALELYEKLVEHRLLEPTFVPDFPADVRPLARPHRDDPRLAEAWDLVVGGVELAVGYSELVDPVLQRERLLEQARRGASGDAEAMELDEEFLRALELGAPPMGGMGLGVDRLLGLLLGRSLRDVILFPFVRPE